MGWTDSPCLFEALDNVEILGEGGQKDVQLANSVETSALKMTRFLLQVFSFSLSDFSNNSTYMN